MLFFERSQGALKNLRLPVLLAIAAAGLVFHGFWITLDPASDFIGFYAGARLSGTGSLYHQPAVAR